MITTIAHSKLNSRQRSGFTLVEMMFAVVITGLVLAASLSSIIFLSRGMVGMINYADMNVQSRAALEVFSRDIRSGVRVHECTGTYFRFDIANRNNRLDQIEYLYSASRGTLSRRVDGKYIDDSKPFQVVLDDIENFDMRFYNLRDVETLYPLEVKEVQIEVIMEMQALQITNTNHIISAKFMMRNKPVSN